MSHLKKLFDSRPWYAMVPDQDHTVVTDGYGTYDADDYLTAMRATNGHTVIGYVPTRRTFSVDLSEISGAEARAWWFNPRDGSVTNFATYPTGGNQSFTSPDTEDWVLILDDSSQSFGVPGAGLGTAPTISGIPNQLTALNTPTAAIPFTISDADTPATNLTLGGESSNPALVPAGNIVFEGSGSDRTVIVTPALNQTGSATITVRVSDWLYSTDALFVVTVKSPGVSLVVPAQTAGQIASSGFRLYVTAGSPGTLAIECTTNFASWQEIATIVYTDSPVEVVDPNATQSVARFYRARQP